MVAMPSIDNSDFRVIRLNFATTKPTRNPSDAPVVRATKKLEKMFTAL
jgi:hypothetical protein